jgi:hypothetical protein
VVGYIEQTGPSTLQGLRINIEWGYEETLDFDAPNLHTLNGTLEVYGGVSRFDFPAYYIIKPVGACHILTI